MTDVGRLHDAGLRVTSARLAILEAVRSANHPGTGRIARAVRERIGHVPVQAVHEAPGALTAAGLTRRIEPPGAPGRDHLVSNIAAPAGAPEVTPETKSGVADYRGKVHPDLGARVVKELHGAEVSCGAAQPGRRRPG